MNCPSRTDEDLLFHPGWNQSPPRFAADLTTREDLNGIANARELGEAYRLRSMRSLDPCQLEGNFGQEMEKGSPITMGEGVKGSPTGTLRLQNNEGDVMLMTLQDLAPEHPRT
jgi:zinc transporter 1/2/3